MARPEEWLATALSRLRQAFHGQSRGRCRIAMLIDGDSTPSRYASLLLENIATRGTVTVARIYANFASSKTKGWATHIRSHGMVAIQHFTVVQGKNSAHIALVEDAVDLVHTSTIDAFCIVSSDSDIAPLVRRLVEGGYPVYGYRADNTPAAVKHVCTDFTLFGELGGIRTAGLALERARPKLWSGSPTDAEDLVLMALVRLGGVREWVSLDLLWSELRKLQPGFDARAYGQRSLSLLLRALDRVELNLGGDTPPAARLARPRNGDAPGH